jgi:hypothetical protein
VVVYCIQSYLGGYLYWGTFTHREYQLLCSQCYDKCIGLIQVVVYCIQSYLGGYLYWGLLIAGSINYSVVSAMTSVLV